jgi:hypothetical protein
MRKKNYVSPLLKTRNNNRKSMGKGTDNICNRCYQV